MTTSSSLLRLSCELQHYSETALELAVLLVLNTKCTVVGSYESCWPTCWTLSKDKFVKNDWLCFKEENLAVQSIRKWIVLGQRKKTWESELQESELMLKFLLAVKTENSNSHRTKKNC